MFRFVARLAPQVGKQVARRSLQPAAIRIPVPLARNFCTIDDVDYDEELPKDPKARIRELRGRRLLENQVNLEMKYHVLDGLKKIEQLSTAEIVELVNFVDASDMKLRKHQVEKFRSELVRRSDLGATAEQIAALLADIKHLCPDSFNHAELFTSLAEALKVTPTFTPELFSEAISGMRSFYYVDPAVRAILPIFTMHLKKITEPFTCDDIGMVLYGLHGMNSEYAEAKELITIVTERLQTAEGRFSANGYASALYGLFFMSSEHDEVRALIRELNNRATWEQFAAADFGNAFLGLNALSSDYPETLELIRFLADKLTQSDVVLTSKLIACMVYGCTSMKSDKPEVLEMLTALSGKILASKDFMRHHDVEMAVEALSHMDTSVDEVRGIFSALHIKSKMCKPELDVDILRRLQIGAGVKVYSESPYMVDMDSDKAAQLLADDELDNDDENVDDMEDYEGEAEEGGGEEEDDKDTNDDENKA